jgi:hypothetical protein
VRALLAAAALVLELAAVTAEPGHLRYVRDVTPGGGGPTCVVLDGTVMAHAASRSLDDLRVFAGSGAEETPFVLTESSSGPAATEAATVENLGVQGKAVVFDLVMPARAYSEVDLKLKGTDFLATAEVTGPRTAGATTTLGTFTLYDLSGQHLSRSTVLPLAESTFPRLHVALRFLTVKGEPISEPASVVLGADVPPSREAQTLYSVVATSGDIHQNGRYTVARFPVPAHVPIERASAVLAPGFTGNFVRTMTVSNITSLGVDSARWQTPVANETASGEISREVFRLAMLPEAPLPEAPPVHEQRLWVDAVMAVNLRQPATIGVMIDNGDDKPLPVKAMQLEMRQRKVCFEAKAGETYALRYGDAALGAPIYDYGHFFRVEVAGVSALGPEQGNAGWTPRGDTRPYTERHPELIWVGLLAVVVVLGATAIGSVKQQRGRG